MWGHFYGQVWNGCDYNAARLGNIPVDDNQLAIMAHGELQSLTYFNFIFRTLLGLIFLSTVETVLAVSFAKCNNIFALWAILGSQGHIFVDGVTSATEVIAN